MGYDLRKYRAATVAKWLHGAVLVREDIIYLIAGVTVRERKHCAPYFKRSQPLFRDDDPVQVYVGQWFAGGILFLGTHGKTCVQIDSIEVAGSLVKGPMNVIKHLGLCPGQTGEYEFDGTVLRLTMLPKEE